MLIILLSAPLSGQDVILADSNSTQLKKGNHAPNWEKNLKKKKESKKIKKEEKKKIKKKIKKQHKKNIKQKQKRKHKNQK